MSNTPLRILIVEDSLDDTTLLVRILQKGGYETSFERVETEDAMRSALLEKQWDLILSDYRMPNFDGLRALGVLKESGLDIPFIIVSGTIGEEIAVDAMKAGASDYVMKGNLQRLIPAIERELKDAASREEKNKTERALRESEERYRSLFENMIEGYAYCKMFFEDGKPPDFVYLAVNDAFERLTGLKNVVGKKVSEVIPGVRGSNPELFEIYGRVASTGNSERAEIYLDSLGIWFSLSVYSSEREYFVAVFDNITERKLAEEAVQKSENFLNQIVENLPDMIFVKDAEALRFVLFNKAGEDLLGYSQEDLLGKNDYDFFPLDQADFFVRKDKEVLASGRLLEIDEEIDTRLQGKRILHTKKIPILDSNGASQFLLGISEDITERKRLEEERSNLIVELQNALDQVKTLSRFLPICSSCKKIRDDEGYWNEVETYIGKHSETQFSHSICPDCARKLYPELFEDPGDIPQLK